MHNPNPFDFVPFQEKPLLYSAEELDGLGAQLTGYIELTMTALTPVHIVGTQDRGTSSSRSHMFRQDGTYCVPAASIRGCMRAFIEAVTSGWVSQATPEYPKKRNERHIGFSTFEKYLSRGRTQTRISPPAVTPEFDPRNAADGEIDVASYLFGVVIEPPETEESTATKESSDGAARRGKVWTEDAYLDNRDVVSGKHWLPDIAGDAFMGGAKPSASNWWYLQPDEIWKRSTKDRYGNTHEVAEFVGDHAWGRKFYYHQKPLACIEYYNGHRGQWRYSRSRPFHRVDLSCMEENRKTSPFRIYVSRLPQQFVGLLLLALLPGQTMRHKLGYGKAYGYGSVEFNLESMWLRRENEEFRLPAALKRFELRLDGWDESTLNRFGLSRFVDRTALQHLAQILGWNRNDNLLFTYPPFGKGDFMQPVQHNDLRQLLPEHIGVTDSMKVNDGENSEIAAALFGTKRPIHFRYYQEKARGWDVIAKRRP